MDGELATVETTVVAQPLTMQQLDEQNILVVAEQPGQLHQAQEALIQWAAQKLATLKADHDEAQQSLVEAIENNWRRAPFQKVVRNLEVSITYYEKVHAALELGFCIVPNFPCDVVAIRTESEEPSGSHEGTWKPASFTQQSEGPPLGEGEYVAADATVKEITHLRQYETDANGKQKVKSRWWEADEFQKVALPVKFMKPRVVKATQHAMLSKVFDEVGILPARRKSDPIVLGRIKGPGNKEISFLIAWFIDSRDL